MGSGTEGLGQENQDRETGTLMVGLGCLGLTGGLGLLDWNLNSTAQDLRYFRVTERATGSHTKQYNIYIIYNALYNIIELQYTLLYCALLYCAVLCCTVLCCVLYCTVLYCTVLGCAVLYCALLYCALLYCALLCCTVLYCFVLCCAVKKTCYFNRV